MAGTRPAMTPEKMAQNDRSFSLHGPHRGDVDLDHHSGPCQLHDVEERMGWRRRRAENFRTAPAIVGLGAHVGDIAHDLDDIAEPGAVLLQGAPDLVVGVSALGNKVVLVADVAGLAVFVLGPDAGQKDHPGWSGETHGDGFGETALGPFGIVVVLLLEGWGLGRSGR